MATNGIEELGANAIETWRKVHIENKKKDYKVIFFIYQSIDSAMFKKKKIAKVTSDFYYMSNKIIINLITLLMLQVEQIKLYP